MVDIAQLQATVTTDGLDQAVRALSKFGATGEEAGQRTEAGFARSTAAAARFGARSQDSAKRIRASFGVTERALNSVQQAYKKANANGLGSNTVSPIANAIRRPKFNLQGTFNDFSAKLNTGLGRALGSVQKTLTSTLSGVLNDVAINAGGRLFGGKNDTTGIQAQFARKGGGIGGGIGGALGSVFGPLGSALGKGLGSFLGSAVGSLFGRSKARREKERRRQAELSKFFASVDSQLARLSTDPSAAIQQLIKDQKTAVATAQSLGASSSQLTKLRLLHDKQVAKSFEDLTRSQLESLRGALTADQFSLAETAVGFNEIKQAVQERIALDRQLAQGMAQASKSLLAFRDGLNFSEFSVLKPVEQLEQARRAFESVSRAAQLGDTTAIAQFQDAAERFLSLSRQVNASSAAFANDFANVDRATGLVQGTAERQSGLLGARADAAEVALDASLQGGASAQTLGLLQDYLGQANANFVTSTDIQNQMRDALAEGNQILFDGFAEMVSRLTRSNQILQASEGLTREQLEEQIRTNTRTAA